LWPLDIEKLNLTEDGKADTLTLLLQLAWRAWCNTPQIYDFLEGKRRKN
jgi:hypothetical protein